MEKSSRVLQQLKPTSFFLVSCLQFFAYNVHIDWCNNAIHKHSRRFQHISVSTTCTYMTTSGMHRRPFESRHLLHFNHFNFLSLVIFYLFYSCLWVLSALNEWSWGSPWVVLFFAGWHYWSGSIFFLSGSILFAGWNYWSGSIFFLSGSIFFRLALLKSSTFCCPCLSPLPPPPHTCCRTFTSSLPIAFGWWLSTNMAMVTVRGKWWAKRSAMSPLKSLKMSEWSPPAVGWVDLQPTQYFPSLCFKPSLH